MKRFLIALTASAALLSQTSAFAGSIVLREAKFKNTTDRSGAPVIEVEAHYNTKPSGNEFRALKAYCENLQGPQKASDVPEPNYRRKKLSFTFRAPVDRNSNWPVYQLRGSPIAEMSRETFRGQTAIRVKFNRDAAVSRELLEKLEPMLVRIIVAERMGRGFDTLRAASYVVGGKPQERVFTFYESAR